MTRKISILLPTYNGQAFLLQTLASIANQTAENLEVIICDDASTDATPDLIASWMAEQKMTVRFIKNHVNLGAGENLQQAARAAQGDYLIMCGQDDLWTPDFLKGLAKRLDDTPHMAACLSSVSVINEHDREIQFSPFRNHWAGLPQTRLLPKLLIGNRFCAASVLFRRDHFRADYLGTKNDSLQDWACWLHILCRGFFGYEPDVRCFYRRHAQNLSRNNKGAQQHMRDLQNTLGSFLQSSELNMFLDQQTVHDEVRFWRKCRAVILLKHRLDTANFARVMHARYSARPELKAMLAGTKITDNFSPLAALVHHLCFAGLRFAAAIANRLPAVLR